eukprot:687359-Amphidinium_carterae.1
MPHVVVAVLPLVACSLDGQQAARSPNFVAHPRRHMMRLERNTHMIPMQKAMVCEQQEYAISFLVAEVC